MRRAARWTAFATLSACLAAAVFFEGGVDPIVWQWVAAVIAVASFACLALRSRRSSNSWITPEEYCLAALAAWMLFALVPLPPAVVAVLSPLRARFALDARAAAGGNLSAWLPLSVAPGATLERLVVVLPAMAVFVAARELPRWWKGRRAWIAVAPVIVAATCEAVIGLIQVYSAGASAQRQSASGTYVNRNHYAGLLELAFPLAVAWALAVWNHPRRARAHHPRHEVSAITLTATSGLLAAAVTILIGVIASVSRMGFAATLTGLAFVATGCLVLNRRQRRLPVWVWATPFLLVVAIVAIGSTDMMALRLGSMLGAPRGITDDGRVHIWRETWRLFQAYPWTGAGLGTFEHALYPFRASMTINAVDFAHNDYLQVLAELGIVGLALALALGGCIARRAVAVWLHDQSPQSWLGLGLLAALAAAGMHSLVDFNLYIPANALAMAWLAGVAVSPGLCEASA